MPINVPGVPFKLTPQDMGSPDIISSLLQGQKLGQNYQLFPQQLEAAKLANVINQVKANYAQPMAQQSLLASQLQNQWNPKIWQSQIGLQGAQGGYYDSEANKNNYMVSHPGLMGGEDAKTLQSLMDMGYLPKNTQTGNAQEVSGSQTNGVDNSSAPNSMNNSNPSAPFNTGNPLVDAILNKPYAAAAYNNKMTQGFNYVHAPSDVKSYQIAQLAGAGVDPSEAVQLLTSGETVPDILKSKGFDPNNAPAPDFLPTRGNIQALKQRQVALKEVDSLGDFVREGLGPYSQTINGMSPVQIGQALSGENEDQQAKFLAARMIAPELANVRLMLAQGKAGITAVDQILNKSMMNIGTFQGLVTPRVFDKAQRLADQALRNSFGKASEAYTVGGKSSSSGQASDPLGIR